MRRDETRKEEMRRDEKRSGKKRRDEKRREQRGEIVIWIDAALIYFNDISKYH